MLTYYVKDGAGSWQLFYILRDNLGSITHLVNTSGVVVQELSYDVWGRLRNPVNQEPYGPGSEPTLYLGRGYTGHEHLSQFGKINMNARLYDPAVGRFIYPDPVVQSPDNSQNYNRYAYCLNNPLKYTDPSGEKWWHWGVGILAGTSVTSFTAASVIAGSAMITAGFMTGSAMIVMGTTLGTLPTISASASATDCAVSFNTLYFGDMDEGEDRFSNWFQIEGQKPYAFTGTFRYDNSASWNEWLLQVINNLGGGEFFQDNLGNIYAHYLNMTGKIDAIGRYEGRTIIRTPVGTVNDGISLGHYIFGDNIALNPNDGDHNIDLFYHEFSHTYQSRIMGPLYLSRIGLASALFGGSTESDANWRANKNFDVWTLGKVLHISGYGARQIVSQLYIPGGYL